MFYSPTDIDTSLRAQTPAIGFDQLSGGAIRQPPNTYCNKQMCAVYANAVNLAGVTADDLAGTVGAKLDGDDTALREIFAIGRAFATALHAVGLAWRVDGTATLVRDSSVRPPIETPLVFDGSPVSPGDYYTAGGAVGATDDELAGALRELVGTPADPSADPPVEAIAPDPSLFEAIMSAV